MNDRSPSSAVLDVRFWTAIALGKAAAALTSGAGESHQAELLLAYVDPGSAGFVIVSVLGFLSAVGYTLRNAFGRLMARLPGGGRRRRRRVATGTLPDAPGDDAPARGGTPVEPPRGAESGEAPA